MKRILLFCVSMVIFSIGSFAQENVPVNGAHDEREAVYAFTNATIVKSPTETIKGATLLIQKDKILSVGTNISVPSGAIVTDLKGKYIYPSFIDVYSNYGQSEVKSNGGGWPPKVPQIESKIEGPYNWNEAIKADYNAVDHFKHNKSKAESLRKQGLGAVATFRPDGIVRGSSAFVSLGDGKENKLVLQDKASANYSFNKGSSGQTYPSSLMGAMAL